MFMNLYQRLIGDMNGLDIGVIVASIGYVAKCAAEVVQWIRDRRGQKLDQIFQDAINWVYVNGVQKKKKEEGDLTLEEGNEALNKAAAKAVENARAVGIDLEREVGAENIPARIQSVFAQIKAGLSRNNGNVESEVLK